MLFLLIRHAQAAAQSETSYPDDTLRPLVPKGRKAQRRICRELRKRKVAPSRVFSSPWKRAWQTARIVVDAAGLPKQARIACQGLAMPPDLPGLAAELGELSPEQTIALVGHEPWMSELAALLLTGERGTPRIDFAKSGILGIEVERLTPGGGTLVFFLRP